MAANPQSGTPRQERLTGHLEPTPNGSVYVKPQDMEWKPSQFEGIEIKVLYENKEAGEMTCLLRWQPGTDKPEREGRMVRNAERKALEALGVELSATREEIKARFKLLVKRHHPDANGGDRSSEDRLRDIIQAYNYLKTAGFC